MFTIDAGNARNVKFETRQYDSTTWTALMIETTNVDGSVSHMHINLFHAPNKLAIDASAFRGEVITTRDGVITTTTSG